jgi:hypothetical protein
LKKRSKKLPLIAGVGAGIAASRGAKSFLLLFFKKEALLLPYLALVKRRAYSYMI